jgi:uncharacterized membrane protein YgdD (TMEM256/DUF423 family)
MAHGLGLLFAGLWSLLSEARWMGTVRLLFLCGILLFCGGLYMWVLTDWKPFVLIVPLGGISFAAGWLLLALACLRNRRKQPPEKGHGA